MDHLNNYTLGRGKVYLGRETTFDQFSSVGELYVGNSPSLMLNIESTSLDHYGSDGGINELDASVTTQVTRNGSMTFDDISPDNLLLFFLGTKATISQSTTAVVGEQHNSVLPGLFYQLGATDTNPQGVRNVGSVTVADDAAATFDEGTDFEVDTQTGRIYIVPGGGIVAGTDLRIGYTPTLSTRTRVISGSKPVRGRLRYIEDNPAGENRTFLLPLVEISPSGDFDLKGDTWRTLPFNLKALKRGSMAAVYIDGEPQEA